MINGEDLLMLWQIAEKTAVECQRMENQIDKILVSKPYKGEYLAAYYVDISDGIRIRNRYILVYKIKRGLYFSVDFIFDIKLIKDIADVKEPLIYTARSEINGEWEEYLRNQSGKGFAQWFNLFRDDDAIHYSTKEFPKPDGKPVTDYARDWDGDGKYIWKAKVIGYPLVEITSVQDINDKLIIHILRELAQNKPL